MTRRITAHKGGRTCRAPEARMTPQERGRLDAVLDWRGISFADWIAEQVNEDYEQIAGGNTMTESGFKTIKVGDIVTYKGHRLPQYNGCEAIVTAINYKSNQATLKLPDNHVALVTSDQIEK